jgi:DNA gyrase subunit A
MGRTARGVRGMKLKNGQKIIALIIAAQEGTVLTATQNGFGKRTQIEEYRCAGRGGQGVISIQVNERNGDVVSAVLINKEEEILLISNRGTLVRIRTNEISILGRNTQGVRLINLTNEEKLVGVQPVTELE